MAAMATPLFTPPSVKVLPESVIESASTPVVPAIDTPVPSRLGWMFRPVTCVEPVGRATSL